MTTTTHIDVPAATNATERFAAPLPGRSGMTPRENLLALYRRQEHAWMPVEFSLCPSLEAEFRRRHPQTAGYAEFYGFPMHSIGIGVHQTNRDWARWHPGGWKDGTHFDDWGIGHEPGSEAAMHMTRMMHPLAGADLEAIGKYPWPELSAPTVADLRAEVDLAHARDLAAVGNMHCTVWETAWYLRSMERLMADMMDDAPEAHAVIDRVTALSIERARRAARAGVDILFLGDDIGTQRGAMMSTRLYRRWLKPCLEQVITAARAEKPDLLIEYHTCGKVDDFIGDLIEAGVDILNPVQPEVMDFTTIVARWGGKISFNGTLGTQGTLPFGTPAQVREAVRAAYRTAGPCGGLLCCPTHLVEPEVPFANLEAYMEAAAGWRP